MTTGPTGEQPSQFEQRLTQPKIAAKALEFLLEILYPHTDEENPEIIRLKDIQRRYRLTALQPNGPARQALAQAQRINRSQRQHRQLGLCEFYTGLIFLYFNADCYRAITHFTEARRQWNFENETLPVCLTHYGQGLVHCHDGDYEPALSQFGLAERHSERIHLSTNQEHFLQQIRQFLNKDKVDVREKMWPRETAPAPEVAAPHAGTATERPYVPEPDAGSTGEPRPDEPPIPASRPVDRMNLKTPIPDHLGHSQRYSWYRVIKRTDQFLQHMPQGTWLLVDKELEPNSQGPGMPVVVNSDQEQVHGSVIVKPFGENDDQVTPRVRIHYLSLLLGSDMRIENASFMVTSNKHVTLQMDSQQRIAIEKDKIVGVVIGMWQQLKDKYYG